MNRRALAVLLALVLRSAMSLRAADWDPAKHPRVPKGDPDGGQFAPAGGGVVHYSASPGVWLMDKTEPPKEAEQPKAKAAPATKEQVDKAWELYQAKHNYATIQKHTGLNPKQAATIIFKIKKKQAEAEKAIAAKVEELDKFGAGDAADAKKAVAEAMSHGDAETQAAAKTVGSQFYADEQLVQAAHDKGYSWQVKTSGPNKGAMAWFKNGIQVSGFKHLGKSAQSASLAEVAAAKAETVKTINFGKGPLWEPEPVGVGIGGAATAKAEGLHVLPGAPAPATDWPIGDGVNRTLGTKYPKEMDKIGHAWSAKLTPEETSAVKSYTGSAYHSMNASLRAGGKLTGSAARIQAALAKGQTPPPPELVWRGVGAGNVAGFVKGLKAGDMLRMDGFQSTSINPSFAKSWGAGKVIFEIKPAKGGAYVKTISNYKNEYEYLLPHAARYRVKGSAAVYLDGAKVHVIQLEMQAAS